MINIGNIQMAKMIQR